MFTLRNSTFVTMLFGGLIGTGTAQAVPFQNGSFELGPTAPVNFCSACGAPYIGTFSAPYTGIPGWTVTAGSIDIIYLTGTTGWSASDGLRSIDLDGLSGATNGSDLRYSGRIDIHGCFRSRRKLLLR